MKKILFVSCFFLFALNQVFATEKFTAQDLQNKLTGLSEKTDKIVISYTPKIDHPKIELNAKDVDEFFSLLKLEMPSGSSYCFCRGDLTFALYSEGKAIGEMTYHHDKHVRTSLIPIRSDIEIGKEYRGKLKAFLLKHGVKADKLR